MSGFNLLMILLISCLFWIWVAVAALAHDWYEMRCRSNHDCAPIPGSAIVWEEDQIKILIPPDTHPMVPQGGLFKFSRGRQDDMRPSQDVQWHACILPGSGYIQCLYIPGSV